MKNSQTLDAYRQHLIAVGRKNSWNKREITVTGKGNKTRLCPLGQYAA